MNGQLASIGWSGSTINYNYSATQNNGQITQVVDGISGETVTYQYDALKRLTSAGSTPNNGTAPTAWTEAYGYDGFGNLTGKTGVLGGGGGIGHYDSEQRTDLLPLRYVQRNQRQSYLHGLAEQLASAVTGTAGYTNCNAVADYGSAAADGADPADLNRAFGNLTPGQLASNVAGISTSANPVFLYAGGSNGFAAQYQNTIPDAGAGSPNNGDQGHHFAAFFQIGFAYGAGFGDALARIFEGGEMFFNNLAGSVGPLNSGDIALGMAAVQIGADLASGRISTSGAAGRIRSLCNK